LVVASRKSPDRAARLGLVLIDLAG